MALGLLAIIAKANKPLNPPIEQCLVGGFFILCRYLPPHKQLDDAELGF
jgi:hypothetical protein